MVELATEFGTPLYLYDELTLHSICREFKEEFGKRYPNVQMFYASKAYSNGALLRLINEEGLGLDRSRKVNWESLKLLNSR